MEMTDLQEAFRRCEEAENYGDPLVKISAGGAEIVVISDLHLAAGRMPDGRFSGTENFFADSSLYRFIHAILARLQGRRAILVINGDVVDFLRIIELPQGDEDFRDWQSLLQELGIVKSIQQLQGSFNNWKEKTFGLKTDDYKSVWKLEKCMRGHPEFFLALAEWIESGNQIIISKGNHDLEWYWRDVRNCLRLALAKKLCGLLQRKDPNLALTDVLIQHISKNLLFIDDAMVIDGTFYIEHGHRYDKYTDVVGKPLVNKDELNIPFGSFFNRYLLNQVELNYPYTDNVRPSQNVLPLLIRERFFVAMKLLLYHVPFMLLIIPKRYFRYMFGQVAVLAAAIGIPLVLGVLYLFASFPKLENQLLSLPGMSWPGSSLAKSFASIAASYFLGRIVAYFQLSEPTGLAAPAMKIFASHPEYQLITMGHTHNPDQRFKDGRWFYNTGTWIPIVETDTAEIRDDKTYTFLHFRRHASGQLQPAVVERWDDEAQRAEALVMISDD
jgi:UDP-2,3-diacylglucosamine pyrophosphatase LpxH